MALGHLARLALCLSSSFSTDDDNDTEVEAIEVDTELNLVTECWVEPQSGHVHSTAENWKHLHGLPYQKIPKAVSSCGGSGVDYFLEGERFVVNALQHCR